MSNATVVAYSMSWRIACLLQQHKACFTSATINVSPAWMRAFLLGDIILRRTDRANLMLENWFDYLLFCVVDWNGKAYLTLIQIWLHDYLPSNPRITPLSIENGKAVITFIHNHSQVIRNRCQSCSSPDTISFNALYTSFGEPNYIRGHRYSL